jgi:peroxiredoxin
VRKLSLATLLRSFTERNLLLLLLLVSVGVNVSLALKVRQDQAALSQKPFPTGNIAPALSLRGVRAADESLSFGHGKLPVLLYWFSPTCGWCEANLSNFKALASQASNKYRFVPVSMASVTDLDSYARERKLGFPVYRISSSAAKQYRFQGTPDTLLVTARGSFVRRWPGAYSPSRLTEIEKALSVELPGVAKQASNRK